MSYRRTVLICSFLKPRTILLHPGFPPVGSDVRPLRGVHVLRQHGEHLPADAIVGRVYKPEAQAQAEHALRHHQGDRAERQQHLRGEEAAFGLGRTQGARRDTGDVPRAERRQYFPGELHERRR